jgi:hypothetical protein
MLPGEDNTGLDCLIGQGGGFPAGLQPRIFQDRAVDFKNIENSGVVFDPVPGDRIDLAVDPFDGPFRTEDHAGAEIADPRTQKPEKTADVVDMGAYG